MTLKAMAQEKIERAGISNFAFQDEMLILCGTHYHVEPCNCGASDCDGVQLRPVSGGSIGTIQ